MDERYNIENILNIRVQNKQVPIKCSFASYNPVTGFLQCKIDESTQEGIDVLRNASVLEHCTMIIDTIESTYEFSGQLTYLGYNNYIPSQFYFSEGSDVLQWY